MSGVHTRASGVYTQWTAVWAVVYTPCRSWCVYTDWSLYTGKQLWCIHVSWVAPRVVYTRLVYVYTQGRVVYTHNGQRCGLLCIHRVDHGVLRVYTADHGVCTRTGFLCTRTVPGRLLCIHMSWVAERAVYTPVVRVSTHGRVVYTRSGQSSGLLCIHKGCRVLYVVGGG